LLVAAQADASSGLCTLPIQVGTLGQKEEAPYGWWDITARRLA
jgi:hypothetical protein